MVSILNAGRALGYISFSPSAGLQEVEEKASRSTTQSLEVNLVSTGRLFGAVHDKRKFDSLILNHELPHHQPRKSPVVVFKFRIVPTSLLTIP